MNELIQKMAEYYSGQPERIQHFVKVHSFARIIGQLMELPDETQEILETAAIVHDIGIKVAEEKYHSISGHYQEIEGPAVAEELLTSLHYEPKIIDRVCYLVGHHHTYSDIDGLDYQILVEADFLVNLHENTTEQSARIAAYKNIFRTEPGRNLCKWMFDLEED